MKIEQSLNGRTALVTGATSGIGLGIARALAAGGANLAFNGLGGAAEIEQAEAELSAAGGEVTYLAADLRDPAAIAALVRAATERFGAIDILVNNAGIQHVAPVDQFPIDKWNDIIAINLSAAFHAIRAVVPGMRARGWGRIVNVASTHALVASPFKAAYVSAKHGLAGLTKTVALETATDGITVNAIAPGYVDTPLVRGQVADTARARKLTEQQVVTDVMLAAQPTKRFVTIGQVAALTLYLVGDAAASITGAILPLDGGWTAA